MPQKKRNSKTSNGTAIGSRKVRLTELQKVLMGKGVVSPGYKSPEVVYVEKKKNVHKKNESLFAALEKMK